MNFIAIEAKCFVDEMDRMMGHNVYIYIDFDFYYLNRSLLHSFPTESAIEAKSQLYNRPGLLWSRKVLES